MVAGRRLLPIDLSKFIAEAHRLQVQQHKCFQATLVFKHLRSRHTRLSSLSEP